MGQTNTCIHKSVTIWGRDFIPKFTFAFLELFSKTTGLIITKFDRGHPRCVFWDNSTLAHFCCSVVDQNYLFVCTLFGLINFKFSILLDHMFFRGDWPPLWALPSGETLVTIQHFSKASSPMGLLFRAYNYSSVQYPRRTFIKSNFEPIILQSSNSVLVHCCVLCICDCSLITIYT